MPKHSITELVKVSNFLKFIKVTNMLGLKLWKDVASWLDDDNNQIVLKNF